MSTTFNWREKLPNVLAFSPFRSRPIRCQLAILPTLALIGTGVAIAPTPAAAAAPRLAYSTVVDGLNNPWDITFIGDTMIYTERSGKISSKRGDEAPREIGMSGAQPTYAKGEAGLMGIVAHPQAKSNSQIYTCRAVANPDGSPRDVRVERWRLDGDGRANLDGTIVDNLPLNESGQHSGCRMAFGKNNLLYIGTGDAAMGDTPQDLKSLGGKVLRVGDDGTPPKYNPFYAKGGDARYVLSYGHRNIQGMAIQPGTLNPWTTEHGYNTDDEVNTIWKGGNYGWDPVPGYNQDVPMTDDKKYPNAERARWSSGGSTIAMSGATFINSPTWGEWNGWLAVAVLKGQQIKLFQVDKGANRIGKTLMLPDSDRYGRLRAVQQGPDGALYVATTSQILRIKASNS